MRHTVKTFNSCDWFIVAHHTIVASTTDCDPSHPSSCADCVCWDTIPAARDQMELKSFD